MRPFERPAAAWPDRAEADRWTQALETIAALERTDRRVDEPVSVTCDDYGSLWANYGPIRIRVAGPDPDVSDDTELLELIDRWVAFERNAGPRVLLDRDQEYIANWRAQLPEQQAFWERVAGLVLGDVIATTGLMSDWRVTVHEDEPDWPRPPAGEHPSGITIFHSSYIAVRRNADEPWTPPRRPLLLPELFLHADSCQFALPAGLTDVPAAVAHLVDQVQGAVIDETWKAWPPCPDHEHPLELGGSTGTAWVCPATGIAVPEVGRLASGR